jgi:hypothetical protein
MYMPSRGKHSCMLHVCILAYIRTSVPSTHTQTFARLAILAYTCPIQREGGGVGGWGLQLRRPTCAEPFHRE